MISAYAPTSTNASEIIKAEFKDSLATTIARRNIGDILIICADANASLGRRDPKRKNDDAFTEVGPHAIDYANASCRRLRSFLELRDFTSLSSFFKKKYYSTWQHPRSKVQHQLDHILILKSDL